MYFYGIGDVLTLTEDFDAILPYETRWLNRDVLALIDVDIDGLTANEKDLEFFITIPKGAMLKITGVRLLKTGKDRDFFSFKNVKGWEDGPDNIFILRKHLLPEFPAEIEKQNTFEDIAYRRLRRFVFEELRYKPSRYGTNEVKLLEAKTRKLHQEGHITDEQRAKAIEYIHYLYAKYR